MKNKIIKFASLLLVISSLFMLGNIGAKFFFHDFLYEAPNLKGLTLGEANNLVDGKFTIINMGEHFSAQKKGEIYSQKPFSSKHIKKGRPIKIWVSKGVDAVTIPDISGKKLQEVRAVLNDLGLVVNNISYTRETRFNNIVLGSDPQIGATISRSKPVSLLVNRSKIEDVWMPDILGAPLSEGIRQLKRAHLTVGGINYVPHSDFPKNTIIDTNHTSGDKLSAGTIINITVTTGAEGGNNN